MSARLIVCLIVVAVSSSGVGFAEEPPTPRAKSQLEQQLDELDLVDQQLAQAREQLASTKNRALRRQLQARIDDLQIQQERLLLAIEQVVGPLPPVVRPEPPLPLEEDLKAQQRHHEAILESDVQRRLLGN